MGRPRSVPEKDALERALLLFWEQGYDRTSIADLSATIGVGPSSIYNAFGSKLEIFRQALALYMDTHVGFSREIFENADDRPTEDSVGDLLRGAVMLYTAEELPQGCAMMQSGGAGIPADSQACAITMELKQSLERSLHALFLARKRAGDALASPPHILSKYIVATMRGLSQLACDGASRRDLLQVADHVAKGCIVSSTR